MNAPRIDLIGCGAVTQRYHAPALRLLARQGRVTVRTCVDRNLESAQAAATLVGAKHSASGVADLDLGGVDGALIATPPESHAELAEHYLAAGKHVLIEKPFVATQGEAARLLERAEAGRGRILVGHFRRFYPSLQAARNIVAGGVLGPVRRIEASEGARWEWPTASDYVLKSPLGGVLFDTGSHVVDAIVFVMGWDDPDRATPFTVLERSTDRGREPVHHGSYEILAGDLPVPATIRLRLSRIQPLAAVIKVIGTSATLMVPGSFAEHAQLIGRSGDRVFVAPETSGAQPTDAFGCFLLEHEAFLAACNDPDVPSILDGPRFETLSALLEALAMGPEA